MYSYCWTRTFGKREDRISFIKTIEIYYEGGIHEKTGTYFVRKLYLDSEDIQERMIYFDMKSVAYIRYQ